ncbi:MAG: SPOR domain-containing protein [Bacteroidales bacterium]|jgi:hypothetical protein|nr:SPOR domain-containing protein [Bacteroidales bacterium]
MKVFPVISLALALCNAPLQGIAPVETSRADSSYIPEAVTNMPILSSFPSELTVEGLLSLTRGNYVIQMGAFNRRANAETFCTRIEKMLGVAVEVTADDNLFKVLINSSLAGTAPCLYIPVSFPEPAGRAVTRHRETETVDNMPAGDSSKTIMDTLTVSRETEPLPEETEADETMVTVEETVDAVPLKRNIHNMFFLKGDNLWLTRYNYFGKSVALVNALIFTIIGSFATMIILLVVILLNRNRMEKEAKLRQYLLERYQALVIDYLFGSTGPDEFVKIASDNYRRQVLIDQMIDVSVNLKGDSGEKLIKLYRDLDLDSDSLARARSRRWHRKIKGFRELAFMGIRDGNEEMYKSLNSRNEILRMEAQIALVRLSERDHFEFLSHLTRPFSLWEQITLHDLIIQHEIPVPEFQRWLNSPNPTVVMFALRMIREFKQMNAEPEIRKSLLHRDPRVSMLAVEVAGDMGMRSSLDTMKRMYKFQEYNTCLEIVKSMGKMPEQAMLGFLKLVLDKEDDVQLQIEAVKAIENMGEVGVQALVKVMKSEYKNYNIIVRHVLDRRIY